jgi:NTP pyrophosphatase (non-canonical NTP hydrolase)
MNKFQQQIDGWFKERGWEYWTPHEIMTRLFEEGGELARLVNHLYGPKKKKDSETSQDLEGEIGDILYTLACFANSHNINLDKCFQKSIDKVKSRDRDRYNKQS